MNSEMLRSIIVFVELYEDKCVGQVGLGGRITVCNKLKYTKANGAEDEKEIPADPIAYVTECSTSAAHCSIALASAIAASGKSCRRSNLPPGSAASARKCEALTKTKSSVAAN